MMRPLAWSWRRPCVYHAGALQASRASRPVDVADDDDMSIVIYVGRATGATSFRARQIGDVAATRGSESASGLCLPQLVLREVVVQKKVLYRWSNVHSQIQGVISIGPSGTLAMSVS